MYVQLELHGMHSSLGSEAANLQTPLQKVTRGEGGMLRVGARWLGMSDPAIHRSGQQGWSLRETACRC